MNPGWVRWVPLVVGVVEIVLFVLVAQAIGVGWAILAYLGISAAGVALVFREGRRAWETVREVGRTGRVPAPAPGDPGARVLAGVLIAVPGLLSGAAGLVLLLPWAQRRLAARRPRPNLGGATFPGASFPGAGAPGAGFPGAGFPGAGAPQPPGGAGGAGGPRGRGPGQPGDVVQGEVIPDEPTPQGGAPEDSRPGEPPHPPRSP